MVNNDVLRRLRYARNISDLRVMELFRLADHEVTKQELESIFKKDDEPGYAECGDPVMRRFLEGLIISRRGARDETRAKATTVEGRLTNNDILKSLRIALELRDDDIIGILGLAGIELSKSELSSFFRKPGQRNHRPCGDQFLRNFLVGLTTKYRV